MMNFLLHPLGDHGVLLDFGTEINPTFLQQVQLVSTFLEDHPPPWMIEFIPAFTTITILYDPIIQKYGEVCLELKLLMEKIVSTPFNSGRLVHIPVYYGNEMGPDLDYVATSNGLTTEEIIQIHSSGDYLVYMIGFVPGFPYIGGMSERIATPRKETPRLKIPSRSVGIAGLQTGIYPLETPGGWQIIGRTPLELFLPNEETPSLLRAGDKIKFIPITREEYKGLEQRQS